MPTQPVSQMAFTRPAFDRVVGVGSRRMIGEPCKDEERSRVGRSSIRTWWSRRDWPALDAGFAEALGSARPARWTGANVAEMTRTSARRVPPGHITPRRVSPTSDRASCLMVCSSRFASSSTRWKGRPDAGSAPRTIRCLSAFGAGRESIAGDDGQVLNLGWTTMR